MALGIISLVMGPILSLINKAIPDKDLRDKLAAELQSQELQTELSEVLAQLNVNANEAENMNLFVAGWRPFIGWVCGLGLAYNTVVLALIKSLLAFLLLFGVDTNSIHLVTLALPQIDMVLLGNILLQMLGMGYLSTLRSFEKLKGIHNIH